MVPGTDLRHQGARKTTMIVALARKLLIALWRLATTGLVPNGVIVGERTRIINRMKAALARLGIRGFKPGLRKAPQRLEALRTPEDTPIPPNMLDEVRRDMIRLAVVREQIDAIERARLVRL